MINAQPVILCGGSGTRLWQLFRTGSPKQFLCLTGNESLFQLAAERLDKPCSIPLEIKEVQLGSYLVQDVIVRFEDKCGQTK